MAGTIVVTTSAAANGYTKYSVAWTSDGAGAVSATAFDCRAGIVRNAKYVPGTGGTQPTNLYDVTVTDADGADVLVGGGADRSNATANYGSPGTIIDAGSLTPVVANAGAAKTGTIVLYVGP